MAFQTSSWWRLVLVQPLLIFLFSCNNNTGGDRFNIESSIGEQLFIDNCVICHGINGDLQTGGASNLQISEISIENISEIIQNGKNGMPSFRSIIVNDSSMDSLVNYVSSLRKL